VLFFVQSRGNTKKVKRARFFEFGDDAGPRQESVQASEIQTTLANDNRNKSKAPQSLHDTGRRHPRRDEPWHSKFDFFSSGFYFPVDILDHAIGSLRTGKPNKSAPIRGSTSA
jgi:hypothetical protein